MVMTEAGRGRWRSHDDDAAEGVGGINLWSFSPPNRIDPSRVFLAKLGLRTRKR